MLLTPYIFNLQSGHSWSTVSNALTKSREISMDGTESSRLKLILFAKYFRPSFVDLSEIKSYWFVDRIFSKKLKLNFNAIIFSTSLSLSGYSLSASLKFVVFLESLNDSGK